MRAHQVLRPPPGLLVDPAHVLPEEPDAEQDDASEEEEDSKEREHPLHLGADDQAAHREEDDERECDQGDCDTDQRKDLQRYQ